ncbi:hypothetical protein KOW79_002868 [Hemibagrus wyckioides]|uniref:Ig-like domain-containing protein n=1 Tax=Hemibagrus wyckioides TaxID=337641 RepID=A0A9D3SRB4_9TELE|nr:hypothetical protein KOW79_002868 [Hemibagrus wyckioides]
MILNSVSVTGFLLSLTVTGLAAYSLTQEKSKLAKSGDKVSILCTAENDDYYIACTVLQSSRAAIQKPPAALPVRKSAHKWSSDFAQGTNLVISGRPSSPPSLLLLTPSGSPLSDGDVSVMCVARGFYPDSVTVSWSENSSSMTGDEVQTSQSQRQADGTFSQTSVLKLSKQRWSSGRTYMCRLSHPALSAPLSQSTSLDQCV